MIRKKYLTDIKILYVSFKKRRVINFNHTDNSLDKNAINEVTSSYKYYIISSFDCYKKPRGPRN